MTKKIAFTLTSAASKRLIARAVAAMPEVKHAKKHGRIIVANGTTNAYVVEELGFGPLEKGTFSVGVVTDSAWLTTPARTRQKPLVLEQGEISQRPWTEVLAEFGADDVFIKGGNALDLDGNVGVLLGSAAGGTIGNAFRFLVATGAHLVLPVGLEKLVPSVLEAASALGIGTLDHTEGIPCGMFPISYGTVMTELDALALLYDAESTHVASGGFAGCEGAVGLVAWGHDNDIERLQADLPALTQEHAIGKIDFSE
jgi:hypothetical protein